MRVSWINFCGCPGLVIGLGQSANSGANSEQIRDTHYLAAPNAINTAVLAGHSLFSFDIVVYRNCENVGVLDYFLWIIFYGCPGLVAGFGTGFYGCPEKRWRR